MIEKISGVYRILNTKNNKVYVGSSYNTYNRFRSHRNQLIKGKHFNRFLQNAYDFGCC